MGDQVRAYIQSRSGGAIKTQRTLFTLVIGKMETRGTSKILLGKAAAHRLKNMYLEIQTRWKSLSPEDQIVH